MSTVLRTKRSTTPSQVPSSLQLGELAVNIPDKKIWIGDGAQSVLIADYNSATNEYEDGYGINVDTNNSINLDLTRVTTLDTIAQKADRIPFLDVSQGSTELITVQNLFRNAMIYGLSTSPYAPGVTDDEYLTIAVQDNNPNAFRIATLQNEGNIQQKNSIFKIDTEGTSARILLGGTSVSIEPSVELNIGTITTDINIISQIVNCSNLTEMNLGTGVLSVSNISAATNNTVYITGNLIVSGYVETDVGVRGGTDAELEYLGENMVMDGGSY
jgi:hypothetical protein